MTGSCKDGKVQKIKDVDFSDPEIVPNPNITLVDIHTIMETGMNVARFLPSCSTADEKVQLINKVSQGAKYLARKYGMMEWPCATSIQLKTCVVKTGILEKGSCVSLKKDSEVILTCDYTKFDKCNEKQIFVDNPFITSEMKVGMEISLRQQAVVLEAKEICKNSVVCTVIKPGNLRNMDSVCMRGAKRVRPYLSKKDLELAQFAVEHEVDMIIVQYVRHPETIKRLKKFIGSKRRRTFLLCGICTSEGLRNLDDIIKEADGVVVSREYLSYELENKLSYRMDRIQKLIVGKCIQAGKPVYISGQIFESVFKTQILQPQDADDVANCLLSGVAGFLLKPWDNPDTIKLVIKELTDLCTTIEPLTNDKIDFWRKLEGVMVPVNAAMAAVMSCVMLANETQAGLIVIPTVSGRTIYHLNSLRANCIILAVTTNIRTFRLLQIHRSVVPILYKDLPRQTYQKTMKARVQFAVDYAVDKNWLGLSNLYITLQKGAELSPYCDTVSVFKVFAVKDKLMTCDEHGEDFDTASVRTRLTI